MHNPPQDDHETGDIKEGTIDGEQAVVAHDQTSEVSEPGVGALHDPATSELARFVVRDPMEGPFRLRVKNEESYFGAISVGCDCLVLSMKAGTILAQGGKDSSGLGNIPPMKIGELQPAMDFTTLEDNEHPTWTELKGKVVILDFWATWCAPCLAAFPGMNALTKEFAGQQMAWGDPAGAEKYFRFLRTEGEKPKE